MDNKNIIKEARRLISISEIEESTYLLTTLLRKYDKLSVYIKEVIHLNEQYKENPIKAVVIRRLLDIIGFIEKDLDYLLSIKEVQIDIDNSKKTIFFSYAWNDAEEGNKSREILVDDLYESLKSEGFNVIRDKIDLEYRGLISKFIEKIGQGDAILVFISDKYLKSPYCMFELYEIYRNSTLSKEKFVLKILPVRIETLYLNNPSVLLEYFQYWENLENEWKKLVLSYLSSSTLNQFEKIKTIRYKIGELISHLNDMNSETIELLSRNDFEKIKKSLRTKF
ncbi:TIR domain-containing protein [Spirosoma sp. HMF4905]|uniref:TIR domain-containing protein n=1 Tax=Spirosoma arboris TaxID=2682092 RepID=A0A7K1SCA2_9BACT|nr:toll/interleukin-1 receptor domain-containing protein [Spirosoma arboris]MVM31186.1 TIR domain-containing protein [Spirosoma arboris]